MSGNLFRRLFAGLQNCKYRSVMILALVVTTVAAVLLLVMDGKVAADPVTEIERNTYGHGSITEILRVIIDGKEQQEDLEITVDERHYTREEMEQVFDQAIQGLEGSILGDNESLDYVRTDLNLITEIPGEPIQISWELDRYDLMNIYGELNEEALQKEISNIQSEEGLLIKLKACLTYTEDETMQAMEELTVRVYPEEMSGEGQELAAVKAAVEQQEESSKEEETVTLPEEVDGKEVTLHHQKDQRGWYLLAMGPLICMLLAALQKQERLKAEKEREQQMMLDYPEIVNKLTLLLGAGMTVKNAWQRIVQDYEEQRESRGVRYAYEEMAAACHEMGSGITESESYERFGKRCNLKSYRKLAALLTQNLRKGTRGLGELLKIEADQAFEERKATAKRRGEEAGTKLLAPMFLMLATVLVIVIVPAFLSIQM